MARKASKADPIKTAARRIRTALETGKPCKPA